MELTDFLLARIAEDEATRHLILRKAGFASMIIDGKETFIDPAAQPIINDCEAKRRIAELHDDVLKAELDNHDASALGADLMHRDILRLLALPYADHADYRDEWRP